MIVFLLVLHVWHHVSSDLILKVLFLIVPFCLHNSVDKVTLELVFHQFIFSCWHYLVTFTLVDSLIHVFYSFMLCILILRLDHCMISILNTSFANAAIIKLLQILKIRVILKGHCWMKHFHHFLSP